MERKGIGLQKSCPRKWLALDSRIVVWSSLSLAWCYWSTSELVIHRKRPHPLRPSPPHPQPLCNSSWLRDSSPHPPVFHSTSHPICHSHFPPQPPPLSKAALTFQFMSPFGLSLWARGCLQLQSCQVWNLCFIIKLAVCHIWMIYFTLSDVVRLIW